MASICPKDMNPCPDDLCRGSGVCLANGAELLEQCANCRQTFSRDLGIECACDRDDYDDGGCPTCDGSGELPHDCGDDTCCCLNPSGAPCPECGGA